ncbi:MAG: SprT-like domain-containing protein, partial [Bacteroidia bacterium]|nr:SprT-like domain-containing protein [Bacteroidia bacterium]
MNNKEQYQQVLSKYLPLKSIDLIVDWIIEYKVNLKISKSRTTKLGDYHPPTNKHGHRISINHDLNKYAFLITLVHEIAHLINWEKYKNKVRPHGEEWKNEYQELMKCIIDPNIFPHDILAVINDHMTNPFASSCTDIGLMRILRKYDSTKTSLPLEDIPQDTYFKIKNGRTFYKG